MPTLRDVADYFGLTSELQMAAKLGVKAPVSTLALLKAYEKAPPVAHFKVDVTDGTIPFKVQFTDESRGYVTSRVWDFDDTKSSNEVSPLHTYDTTNCTEFNPKLTLKNPSGQDVYTLSSGIISRPKPPNITIAATPMSGPAPLKVQFHDTSFVYCFEDRLWTFPDGSTSTSANPSYIFQNPGTTTIQQPAILQVHNLGGNSETWVEIQVGPEPPQPPPGQGPAPYIYVEINVATETITVHGAHFLNGASIIVDLLDSKGNHRTYQVPGTVAGGEFTATIVIEACDGQNHNPLAVKATWDGGQHYSNTYSVIC